MHFEALCFDWDEIARTMHMRTKIKFFFFFILTLLLSLSFSSFLPSHIRECVCIKQKIKIENLEGLVYEAPRLNTSGFLLLYRSTKIW